MPPWCSIHSELVSQPVARSRLTRARRNLLDRLLVQLMDRDESARERQLARLAQRAPRMHVWLVRLLEASAQTSGPLDELFARAGSAARRTRSSGELELAAGACLGPWRVLEAVGSGGMGTVYRAERADGAFEMTVAVKLIRLRRDNLDERLKVERQLLARLNHRHIARLIDGGTTDHGYAYLVMDWIDGFDLDEYLDRHPGNLAARLELFEQIGSAVAHAHQRQVVHGDLKPANVRVTADGRVRLVDFGVARLIHDDEGRGKLGPSALTPAFCAPEQLRGESASTQSDTWSLGVLLQWLLSGRIRQAEAGHSVADELPADLVRRQDLVAIIDRACAELPDDRYAGVSHLLDDVRRCRQGYPVQARPQTRRYLLASFVRRHRLAAAAALAGSVLLCAALVGALWQAHHATQQRDRAALEADRALQAERQSERLARELQQVVDFQSERLAAVDPAAMGVSLRRDILDRRRTALEGLIEDTERIERELEGLDQSLAGVNFTDVALVSLERRIFEPTLATIDREFADQPSLRARLLQVTATTLRELGRGDLSEDPQTEALRIRREQLGDLDLQTLVSIREMGALQGRLGHYQQQRRYYQEALDGFREVLGEDHLETLIMTGSMGTHYHNIGENDQAEEYFRQVLEQSRALLGQSHSQTIASLSNMGSLLGGQERFDEAMPYYREVLEVRRATLGDRHPDTLRAVSNMGWLLQQKQRLDEALPLYREALEGRRQVLGNDHPATMVSVNNMGFLLSAMGRPEQAESFSLEAMNSARRMYGNDHHRTLIFINNSSSLLQSLGRNERAEALALETVERGRRILPAGHWHLGVFSARLALARVAQERYAEAEAPMLEAYELYRDALGEDNSRTGDIVRELVELYAALHERDRSAGHDRERQRWQARLDQT